MGAVDCLKLFGKILSAFVKRVCRICLFYDFIAVFAKPPLLYNSRSCIMVASADNC